ncbi:hypothetical protein K461DRAFT_46561 [Myriangium duriaei CBS 260.36]|uniref:Uncharacterized protein n=1 Tax=Myriangium duriaei CBS 260.36 TaxID=1168546 RepID=A0A9P4IVV2_9PEZI|nr:hypothetical protein K461DRAFT_46561 [Myriangium duriaei CBS 260.36]
MPAVRYRINIRDFYESHCLTGQPAPTKIMLGIVCETATSHGGALMVMLLGHAAATSPPPTHVLPTWSRNQCSPPSWMKTWQAGLPAQSNQFCNQSPSSDVADSHKPCPRSDMRLVRAPTVCEYLTPPPLTERHPTRCVALNQCTRDTAGYPLIPVPGPP